MCERCGAAIPAEPHHDAAPTADCDESVRTLMLRTYEQYPHLREQDALFRRLWDEDRELCEKDDLDTVTFDTEDELRDLLTRAAERWPDLSVRELLRCANEDPRQLRGNTLIELLAHASRRWPDGEGTEAGSGDRAT